MGNSTRIGDVYVEWLGHSGFMLKSGKTVVYIDPYKISYGEKADIILVTHEHYDHCSPDSISYLRKENTVVIAPKSCKEKIRGIDKIKLGKTKKSMGIDITAVAAYNKNKHFHPRDEGIGYVISLGGKRIYHAGDTDNIPEMENLGKIDLALLPVGGTYTMNAEEAATAADIIGAGLTIPMHWGDIVGTRKDADDFKRLAKVRVEILDWMASGK